jgi:hypothetical protein
MVLVGEIKYAYTILVGIPGGTGLLQDIDLDGRIVL